MKKSVTWDFTTRTVFNNLPVQWTEIFHTFFWGGYTIVVSKGDHGQIKNKTQSSWVKTNKNLARCLWDSGTEPAQGSPQDNWEAPQGWLPPAAGPRFPWPHLPVLLPYSTAPPNSSSSSSHTDSPQPLSHCVVSFCYFKDRGRSFVFSSCASK